MMNEKPAFWAILPATVRYDTELSSTAKLLYAEISALQEAKGYCFAKNRYFAEVFGCSERTVQRLVRELESRGYIRVQIVQGADGELVRMIWTDVRPEEKADCHDQFAEARNDSEEEQPLRHAARDTSPYTGEALEGDKNVATEVSGGDKNVAEGVTKMSPMNNTRNNKTSNTPLKPPTEGRKTAALPKHKPERFVRFWDYYRTHARGENKRGAIRAWDRLKPSDELIDTMAAALARQVRREDWQKGVGIPYASTWLNNARWEDEPNAAEEAYSRSDPRGGLDAW